MKKLRNTIACGVAALALLATGLTSCTGDFDNINTSKDKPTPEDVDRDNAWAAFIQTMQRNVFAEGANAYQLADNLLGDSYAGYFGQAQDWDSGSNSTCYAFPTAKWKDEPYKQAYNNVMSSWNILRQKVDSASVVFALEMVGLGDKLRNKPSQLSGGQQQRASIARALAGDPAVILADEPTGALDSRTGREVLGFLQKLNQEGDTVVLITHDNSIAVQAQRIIRLEDGQVIYDGDASAPEAVVRPDAAGKGGMGL